MPRSGVHIQAPTLRTAEGAWESTMEVITVGDGGAEGWVRSRGLGPPSTAESVALGARGYFHTWHSLDMFLLSVRAVFLRLMTSSHSGAHCFRRRQPVRWLDLSSIVLTLTVVSGLSIHSYCWLQLQTVLVLLSMTALKFSEKLRELLSCFQMLKG